MGPRIKHIAIIGLLFVSFGLNIYLLMHRHQKEIDRTNAIDALNYRIRLHLVPPRKHLELALNRSEAGDYASADSTLSRAPTYLDAATDLMETLCHVETEYREQWRVLRQAVIQAGNFVVSTSLKTGPMPPEVRTKLEDTIRLLAVVADAFPEKVGGRYLKIRFDPTKIDAAQIVAHEY